MNDLLIQEATEYILGIFEGNSDGHDVNHSLRVFRNAMMIAAEEQECDMEAVALAALLHDVDDHKLFDTEDNHNARTFLKEHGFDAEQTGFICSIIESVSFSKNRGKKPSSIEAMIVQDADRLDAMGAVGIARTFAYGGKHGRSLEDSMKHFYEKLLLLKDEMNTESARRLAEERHGFLLDFVRRFENESSVGEYFS
ncbi:uncharacterized protein SAMN02910456_00591 [Ruminococcaceae bacterium YRB3002]|nr:uncharacterized protein SAMN02910456_00591 [Ruminococcaceae bacterium YRB3002]